MVPLKHQNILLNIPSLLVLKNLRYMVYFSYYNSNFSLNLCKSFRRFIWYIVNVIVVHNMNTF